MVSPRTQLWHRASQSQPSVYGTILTACSVRRRRCRRCHDYKYTKTTTTTTTTVRTYVLWGAGVLGGKSAVAVRSRRTSMSVWSSVKLYFDGQSVFPPVLLVLLLRLFGAQFPGLCRSLAGWLADFMNKKQKMLAHKNYTLLGNVSMRMECTSLCVCDGCCFASEQVVAFFHCLRQYYTRTSYMRLYIYTYMTYKYICVFKMPRLHAYELHKIESEATDKKCC